MCEKLYASSAGRMAARLIASPFVSRLAGKFMDSRLSRLLIPGFIKKNSIDLSVCQKTEFDSFNDFFTRRLKPGERPVCPEKTALASPCDGLLSVFPIEKGSVFTVKGHAYTVGELTGDTGLSNEFEGGRCLIFRLTPAHYHRYIWPCDGKILVSKRIRGIFHTVRPGALERVEVFKTNTREYALCESDMLGRFVLMEVGAALVGKIVNESQTGAFKKGEEKGHFEFGGSTVILLLKKDSASILSELDTPHEKEVLSGSRINA